MEDSTHVEINKDTSINSCFCNIGNYLMNNKCTIIVLIIILTIVGIIFYMNKKNLNFNNILKKSSSKEKYENSIHSIYSNSKEN